MMFRRAESCLVGVALFLLAPSIAWAQQEEIDFDRARQLLQRTQQGEKLTEDEREYLERAKQQRQKRRPGGGVILKPPFGLRPMTDMAADARYKDQDGGLYGGGKNQPPEAHLEAALRHAERIRPLNSGGEPDDNGKIVFLSIGMSNTTQEFSAFVQLANDDPAKSPHVVIVDGAQGGMDAKSWSQPQQQAGGERPDPWMVLDRRLQQADVSARQVQVVWIKQARANPGAIGEFPAHAEELKSDMVAILNKLQSRFPNLRIAYLSSRIYAGYAKSALNPEPYAYESAFAVRSLIQDQISGEPLLTYGSESGPVRSPLLLWGPYLWAAGENGRKMDDLVWKPGDFSNDGTHPSNSGRRKVAELLLSFMKNDPTAKMWFVSKRKKLTEPEN